MEQTGPGLHRTPRPSTQQVVGTGPLPPSSGLDCTPAPGGRAGEAILHTLGEAVLHTLGAQHESARGLSVTAAGCIPTAPLRYR